MALIITRKFIYLTLFTLLFLSCASDENTDDGNNSDFPNLSSQFAECNSALSACTNGNGNYCLFGFKWGEDAFFTNAGFNGQGPESPGGVLTFSIQEENGTINTHAQINLPSESFSSLQNCAKDEIRSAMATWGAVADITFEERPENSDSDIRFFVADIRQGGIGYPNYNESPCISFAGNVIIQKGLQFDSCEDFQAFALHEIGHVLGLGHVESANIMNPQFLNQEIIALQAGDLEGIIELYGTKN